MKKLLIIPIVFVACTNPEQQEVERLELELQKATEARNQAHKEFELNTGLNADSILLDLKIKSEKQK